MRFVAVSDTHMAEVELPEGDVLLHAGDLTYQGSLPEVSTAARWLEEEKRKRGFRHVIVVAGNHDWLFQNEPSLARQLLRERGLTYLEDQGITIDGSTILPEIAPGPGHIAIYGSPWQPEFMNWAFNLPRGQAFRDWEEVFQDNAVATAIAERLIENGELIKIEGPSYRLRKRKQKGSGDSGSDK